MNIFSVDELGDVFADVLVEVVSTISGFSLNVLSSEPETSSDELVGIVSLNGLKSGMLLISSEEAKMRTLCSFMTGIPKNTVTKDDIDDAMCELVNIVAGNAKLRLGGSGYLFTCSTPFVVSGANLSVITKKRTCIVSRFLGGSEISVTLRIIY